MGTSGSGGPSRPQGRVASSSIRLSYARSDARAPLLNRQARRRPVRLRVGRVDHQYPGVLGLRGQFGHNGGKHAHPAPPLPTVIERLRWTVGRRRVRAGR